MNEALVAGTLNAAASIGHSDMYGSLEVGKYGDMLILDAPQWEHLFYRIGDEPIRQVIKKGVIIEM
jgi:probable imidazolonepropionase